MLVKESKAINCGKAVSSARAMPIAKAPDRKPPRRQLRSSAFAQFQARNFSPLHRPSLVLTWFHYIPFSSLYPLPALAHMKTSVSSSFKALLGVTLLAVSVNALPKISVGGRYLYDESGNRYECCSSYVKIEI
jgi:hypothetical protein